MANSMDLILLFILALPLVFYALEHWWKSPFRGLPYPPGPPSGGFISGNLKDFSTHRPWLRFEELAQTYGDLMHFRVVRDHYIVIQSYETAVQLLEKRSSIYSDRPRFVFYTLMGWDFASGFLRYGDRWRRFRRVFQQAFKSNAIPEYHSTYSAKVNDFVQGLLEKPEDLTDHCKSIGTAVMMSSVYSHDISSSRDPFVELVEGSMEYLNDSYQYHLAVTLLNIFPFLKHIPEWFPGAGFKSFTRAGLAATEDMINKPFELARNKIKSGTAGHCLASQLLEKSTSEDMVEEAKQFCSSAYVAGADTTSASLMSFVSAMALYPDVQRKAQAEIDRVVGNQRLPDMADRPSLPYIEAVFREVMRWKPVVPLAITHATVADDIYKGYYIPKGASVLPNTWAMGRDPNVYSNPEEFNPSRFILETGKLNKDEVSFAFGFGRRICPGRHLASAMVWLAIARTLAGFNIGKKIDADGKEIPIDTTSTEGLIIRPVDFECSIVPRSDSMRNLLLEQGVKKQS